MNSYPRQAPAPGTFSTADLYFAAFLKTIDVPMVSHLREGNKVQFCFNTAAVNINELREAWISDTAKVPPLKFSNCVKNLKSLCHMS